MISCLAVGREGFQTVGGEFHRFTDHFGDGGNSKFFAAVAIYQLQEQGKLNVSAPVTDIFDATDYAKFGRPNATTWCPPLASDPEAFRPV